jgi:hypothetical protein
MKGMRKKMLQVKNVTSLIIILLFIFGCKLKEDALNKDLYILKKYKSHSGLTKLVVKTFDKYENEFPTILEVNGIIFQMKIKEKVLIPLELLIKNKHKIDVKIAAIGMKEINFKNMFLKKGDSIVIKVFLKENIKPLN